MLKEIHCNKFASDHQNIRFNSGLNTILGSTGGSNALGKSTFLWIIDYVFGGESYCSLTNDIRREIGTHTIYFTFEFDGDPHYFYRGTDDSKSVYRSDKDGHFITKLSLNEFRKFLFQEYNIHIQALEFTEITERFYRIYGRENTLEKYPLLVKPREQEEKAVDFLLKFFGHYKILASIKSLEEKLGIKASQLKSRYRQKVDTDKIEINQKTIESLRMRLQKLMKNSEEAQLALFGFDTQAFERISAVQKDLNNFIRKRNHLQSQLNAIMSNIQNTESNTKDEFDSLTHFFPNTNIKAFEEIQYFHAKIREILSDEMDQEIERLKPMIEQYDIEITRLHQKIKETGLIKEMSERVLSQCVNVSKRIDAIKEETTELVNQKELQDARADGEQKLHKLFLQLTETLDNLQGKINNQMKIINDIVTEKQETSPRLDITPQKEISFETPGNTSEGTAYKGLVLYDLSLLELLPIPALIHDSNILKRIEDVYLEHILELYQSSKRQIFIAFDKADSTTEKAQKILESTTILHLTDGNELFGRSWSKNKSND